MALDPICGMEVDELEADASEEYEGEMYYFCAEACLERFIKNPELYIKK